ncbi:MAG TPA: tetratricopeptide repeat protein, partial [Conexibacter sp.]
MSTTTDAGLAAGWREQALAALEDGRTAEAREWLRQAVAEATELEWLNDLAVLTHQLGRTDEAEALLRATLAIDPERADAAENLAALAQAADQLADGQARADARWRRSRTLGGPDPGMYERAFPGMPRPDIISEHTS